MKSKVGFFNQEGFWKRFETLFCSDYMFIKWAFNDHQDVAKAVKYWNTHHGHAYKVGEKGYIEIDLPIMYEIYCKVHKKKCEDRILQLQEKNNETIQGK